MDIFSAKPKSFKLHRKSPLASKLKSAISLQLPQFLADYSDDVLAEYITVLVCNGKDQYQARADLEAFLGDTTVDFVSWLWNFISKNAGQSSTDIGSLYQDGVAVVNSQDSDRCKVASTDRYVKFQSDSTSHADEILVKDYKACRVPICDPVSSEDMKLAKVLQHCPSFSAPSSEVYTEKALSRTCRNEILRRTFVAENVNHEILNQGSSGLPKELLPLPKIEAVSQNARSCVSGCTSPKQISVSNNLGSSLSPRFVHTGSVRGEKPRGSVWDRLGKPCEGKSVGHKYVDFYGVGHNKQDGKVHTQLVLIPLKRNPEAHALVKRSYSYPVEMKKVDHGGRGVPHTANNIGRKRLFSEISTGPGTGSVPLVHERNKSSLNKNVLKTTQKLVSPQEVLDVKQRLHQIEMEMSKLQSKQQEIERKDGKRNHLSNSGILKDSEKSIEVESRTVLLTNVHFSATKEALSLFFANCGVVVNVVMLTDTLTAKPKGSAYVTFASKESVDKAVVLSGTTFYSRTVKVLRKAEAASAASAPAQLSAKTFPAHVPHGNTKAIPNKPWYLRSSLQWQRERSADSSEPSAPASVEGVSSFAPKHLSDSHEEGNTPSTKPPATAST